MASKTVTTLIDDIDGSEAAATRTFSLNGTVYEIDLSEQNEQDLLDALDPFVKHARRVSGSKNGGKSKSGKSAHHGTGPATVDREQIVAIRAWARKQGLQVSERGRLSGDVIQQFEAAHAS